MPGDPDATRATTSADSEAEPDVSPIPPLFYWSLFIPAFAVVVFGMQRLLSPRVPLGAIQPDEPQD
jgi:hypothetical protein